MAEIYYVKRLEVTKPPEDAVLPRWSYYATVHSTTTDDIQVISFISETENPETPVDICNTINGLIVDGELNYECE